MIAKKALFYKLEGATYHHTIKNVIYKARVKLHHIVTACMVKTCHVPFFMYITSTCTCLHMFTWQWLCAIRKITILSIKQISKQRCLVISKRVIQKLNLYTFNLKWECTIFDFRIWREKHGGETPFIVEKPVCQ